MESYGNDGFEAVGADGFAREKYLLVENVSDSGYQHFVSLYLLLIFLYVATTRNCQHRLVVSHEILLLLVDLPQRKEGMSRNCTVNQVLLKKMKVEKKLILWHESEKYLKG